MPLQLIPLAGGSARPRLFNQGSYVPNGFGFPRHRSLLAAQLAKCRQCRTRAADLCEHCRSSDNRAVKSQGESYIFG
jgi:hypothetical protein